MNIEIVYCTLWDYTPQASRIEEEIKSVYSYANFTFVKSQGGLFEISLNKELIFSKKELDRFPYENEILDIIKKHLMNSL